MNTVVVGNVKCRRCGYNLRGLIASGKCPECSTPVWNSVQATVDQELLRMPSLGNARLVGDGLFLFTSSMFLSVLLFAAQLLARRLSAWDSTSLRQLAQWIPQRAWAWQLALGLAASVGVFLIRPRSAAAERSAAAASAIAWRDIRLIVAGMACWWGAILWTELSQQGAASAWRQLAHSYAPLANMAGAALMLWGMRGVFADVGQRSRAYRTSESGRQSMGAMLATLAAMLVGRALQVLGESVQPAASTGWLELVARTGATLLWIGGLMLIIGLGYLVMNAWWVRKALYRPSPWYGQLLMPPLPQQTILGDDETSFDVQVKPAVQAQAEEAPSAEPRTGPPPKP